MDPTTALTDPVVIWSTVGIATVGILVYILSTSKKQKKFLPIDDFVPLPLIHKDFISHDVVKFTFGLPTPDHVLGLPIGQHLSLKFIDKEGKGVQRSYTPVSLSNTKGEVSLVIKVYRPSPPKFPNGGQMSQHLDSLKIGDKILVRGPKGHVTWKQHGNFDTKPLGKPKETRQAKHFSMMAGGTGITPMLQILHAIFKESNDPSVSVKLLYANQTEDDILVREELEALQSQFSDRFSLWYTVDKSKGEQWKYDTGFITKEMIQQHACFDAQTKTQFFMCGPPPMIKFACVPALKELGYSEKDWVVF